MGKWIYRKPESAYICATCIVCLTRKQVRKDTYKGQDRYCSYCYKCRQILFRPNFVKKINRRQIYHRVHKKKEACEACGFQALHRCQLDIDHIDGNHHNNDPNNLWTLCSNCHRLKTVIERGLAKAGLFYVSCLLFSLSMSFLIAAACSKRKSLILRRVSSVCVLGIPDSLRNLSIERTAVSASAALLRV